MQSLRGSGWVRGCVRGCGIVLVAGLLPVVVCLAETGGSEHGYRLKQISAARVYAKFDTGSLPQDTRLRRLRIELTQDAGKRNALVALAAAQQDRHSALYRHWLTPEEYGDRYGAGQPAIDQVTAWLVAAGMQDVEVAPGRNFVAFSGSVTALEQAFDVSLHTFVVHGEQHYANVSAPLLPEELRPLVAGVLGLDDFMPHTAGPRRQGVSAGYMTAASGMAGGAASGMASLGPQDLATIYDIGPLYAAGSSGLGSTIAVVGAAVPSLADFRAYKALFGLPANDFQTIVVPGSIPANTDPTVTEAALDLEVAGGIAPRAALLYVQDEDVIGAVEYIVENKLAEVISMSYTVCELPGPEDTAYEVLAQQGVVEGITWVSASGDSGAAACDQTGASDAASGLAVNLPASLPEVTGVGGTQLSSGTASQYWKAGSGPAGGSAIAYMPESAWNGANAAETVTASGGGISKDFPKPGYQSSIPDDVLSREVPDIAFDAAETSPPYLIVSGGSVEYVGGTSAATPLFAGITALVGGYLGQQQGSQTVGLGNINPVLYRLAETTPAAFHDVTSGSNQVSCLAGSLDCQAGTFGYDAAVGYDPVTGLGSVDAYNLATGWESADLGASTVTLSASGDVAEGSVMLLAQVSAGKPPTGGTVVFSSMNGNYASGAETLLRVQVNAAGEAEATLSALPEGENAVTAVFEGTTELLGSVSNTVTITNAQAGSSAASVTLVDAQPEVNAERYLPLAASVTGTEKQPTGSVTFVLGESVLATAPVVAGLATALSELLPPAGENLLTAHYSGDGFYGAAVSAPYAITAIEPGSGTAGTGGSAGQPVGPADFTLSMPQALTVGWGRSASIPVTIVPVNGFASPIVFTCTAAVDGYGCVVPANTTPNKTTTVTVQLQAIGAACVPLISVLLLAGRRWRAVFAGGVLVLATGCGYVVNKPTASGGTYAVTITATSGSIRHVSMVEVTVE